MASSVPNKSESHPRTGLIRKFFQLLTGAIPETKPKPTKPAQRTQAHQSAKVHRAESASASTSHHKKASASKPHHHKKSRHHVKHKRMEKTETRLQNPKDVIPESEQDPAHSPGHRHVHLEKELQ